MGVVASVGAAVNDRGPKHTGLPGHVRLHADPSIQRQSGTEGRTVLLGGSPFRMMRLDDRAVGVFDQLGAGARLDEVTGVSLNAARGLARRLLNGGLAHPRWEGPAQFSPADVTLVVPVKGRVEELRRLLGSDVPERVIVVDDGSDRPLEVGDLEGLRRGPSGQSRPSAAASSPPPESPGSTGLGGPVGSTGPAPSVPVQILRHARSLGPGAARNTGLQAASTPLVAFVDSDVELPTGWLDALLPHFDDPTVALVAPRIGAIDPGGSVLARYESVRSALDLGPTEARISPRTRVAYVPAAALVVRREAFDGFHEGMPTGEDVDAVWRLVDAGWTARYEPTSVVRHDHRTKFGAFVKRRAQYGASAAPLAIRHRHQVPPLAVSGWSALAWGLAATQTVSGVAGAAAVVAGSSALLPAKLPFLAKPWPTALKLALRGHLGAGRQISAAILRTWWPLAVSGWSALAWGLAATQTVSGVAGAAVVVAGSSALLPAKLPFLAKPWPTALKLALRGHLGAGRQISAAILRTWWPLAVPMMIRSRRARRALLAAAVVPQLLEWRERRPTIDPVRFTLLRIVEDGAYCIGVWQGCVERRTIAPLVPDLSSWPGRRAD